MNPKRRLFTASVGILGMSALVGGAAAAGKDDEKGKGKGKSKAKHKNGKQLLGDKIKKNGKHALETVGPHSARTYIFGSPWSS